MISLLAKELYTNATDSEGVSLEDYSYANALKDNPVVIELLKEYGLYPASRNLVNKSLCIYSYGEKYLREFLNIRKNIWPDVDQVYLEMLKVVRDDRLSLGEKRKKSFMLFSRRTTHVSIIQRVINGESAESIVTILMNNNSNLDFRTACDRILRRIKDLRCQYIYYHFKLFDEELDFKGCVDYLENKYTNEIDKLISDYEKKKRDEAKERELSSNEQFVKVIQDYINSKYIMPSDYLENELDISWTQFNRGVNYVKDNYPKLYEQYRNKFEGTLNKKFYSLMRHLESVAKVIRDNKYEISLYDFCKQTGITDFKQLREQIRNMSRSNISISNTISKYLDMNKYGIRLITNKDLYDTTYTIDGYTLTCEDIDKIVQLIKDDGMPMIVGMLREYMKRYVDDNRLGNMSKSMDDLFKAIFGANPDS